VKTLGQAVQEKRRKVCWVQKRHFAEKERKKNTHFPGGAGMSSREEYGHPRKKWKYAGAPGI